MPVGKKSEQTSTPLWVTVGSTGYTEVIFEPPEKSALRYQSIRSGKLPITPFFVQYENVTPPTTGLCPVNRLSFVGKLTP